MPADSRDRVAEVMAEEQTKQMMIMAAYGVGFAICLRLLAQIATVLFLAAFPMIYLHAIQTCPNESTFDAKKELKRVMRGENLSENDPNKPKGFWEKTMARAKATVGTELATSLGYEVSFMNFGGAFIVACVRVQSLESDCYWVGVHGGWKYIMSRTIPMEEQKAD
uniref:Uncharacterized protein n=1 Tax=Trieres chinensis TaxID=1514140 RepID=A0A7S2EWT4_TRICV|eukprot:CAMPEP_0183307048 /NCGR_PEP_ID=MMETSP0160_2-20130417/15713_1 /TAXON_ID=2839 ORGANISM="Odontella Sinensis, Strain Grunow 1884" /NCGR_SAMPLE_ID=MMETSP0160_2 /ASSEMBLY_ACC=CAM_ASM_000250 /LENGTH=165 /DNA_ID=CAMNT_0025470547 /DNA_START=64 /DNA_END=564 /DNA_ORIENTATION=-